MNSKCLRPQIFETDVNAPDSAKKWKQWKKTFEDYVSRIEGATARDKLDILVSLLDTSVYSYVSECDAYDDAVARLENAYVKPVNEIFARHRLNTCKQNPDESLEDFLERSKSLSNNCNFTDCTAAQIRETAAIRDAFISGMQSGFIQQRILEDNVLALNDVFDKARRLNEARKNASLYDLAQNPRSSDYTAASCSSQEIQDEELCQAAVCASSGRSSNCTNSASSGQSLCFFCGGSSHKRAQCPARQMNCYKCGRKGHFAKKVSFPITRITSINYGCS